MKKETFKELFEAARKRDEYWIAYAKLEFTEKLRHLMEEKKETKASFAKKLGKSPPYITKIFRGNVNFTLESMVRFVRAIGGSLKIELEGEVIEQVHPRVRKVTYEQAWVKNVFSACMNFAAGQTPDVSVRVIGRNVGKAWTQQVSSCENKIQISPKPTFPLTDKDKIGNYAYATA